MTMMAELQARIEKIEPGAVRNGLAAVAKAMAMTATGGDDITSRRALAWSRFSEWWNAQAGIKTEGDEGEWSPAMLVVADVGYPTPHNLGKGSWRVRAIENIQRLLA